MVVVTPPAPMEKPLASAQVGAESADRSRAIVIALVIRKILSVIFRLVALVDRSANCKSLARVGMVPSNC